MFFKWVVKIERMFLKWVVTRTPVFEMGSKNNAFFKNG
jgi:hypothetical protein